MAAKNKPRPKFKVGQVVCVKAPIEYGLVNAIGEKVSVEFWDAENNDRWYWEYEFSELRALNRRERGA